MSEVAGEISLGPDGGWQGWIAILALWTRATLMVGILKGMGIMLPTLQDQLATQTWIIGWITAMISATSGFVAPFAGLLSGWFGSGYVIMTCGALVGVAAIAGSFTETALQLALVHSLFAGMGLGVWNVLAMEAVGRRFSSRYATATGVARTGYSIGLFIFGPLVQLFLNTYGWRGTMLLMGGISLHGVVCGALMVTAGQPTTQSTVYQGLPNDEPSSTHRTSPLSCCSTFWGYVVKQFDLELLLNANYWSLAVLSCSSMFAHAMWIVYFVSLVQSNGFSLEEAGTFVTVAGVASLLAKFFQGHLSDRGIVSSWSLTAIFTSLCSVSYCATPWLTSYWTMMASALVILFCDGVTSCQIDVLIKQTLGVDLLAGAFGWIQMKTSVLSTTLGFLPGLLYDNTGSYTVPFLMMGAVQALAVISLFVLRYGLVR